MEQKKQEFLVSSDAHRMRLDRYIASVFPDLNRRGIDRLLRGGNVYVGDKQRDRRYFVKQGQRVTVIVPASPSAPPSAASPQSTDSPRVLFHTPDLIALNKPPGLPTADPDSPCLLSWLEGWLASRSMDHVHPGVLHRLDKDTSGVILFSLSPKSHRLLLAAWRRRTIGKVYTGLVTGRIRPRKDRIEIAIGRDHSGRMVPDPDGLPATTVYERLNVICGCSLISCSPISGRTHQIRCHLREVGHPILADPIYGTASTAPIKPAPRLWLHASRLTLPKKLAAELDWPTDIEAPLWDDLAEHLSSCDRKPEDQ
jgi:RluA family pseudouridine synthase